MRLVNATLLAMSVVLFLFSTWLLLISRLDHVAYAQVVGIQRNSGVDLQDNNYWVTYEFFINNQHTARGSYLLENPATLGDMPRLHSDLTVRYSTLYPQVNRPWGDDELDYSGLFQAELALLAALTLLLCGLRLR